MLLSRPGPVSFHDCGRLRALSKHFEDLRRNVGSERREHAKERHVHFNVKAKETASAVTTTTE